MNPNITPPNTEKESWSKPQLTVVDVNEATLFNVSGGGTDSYYYS